jgi:uncharacterized protein YbjT (DUF2867 family)
MITPRWVATRTQPIAVDDVVRYLLGVLARPESEAAGRVFEAGDPRCSQRRAGTPRIVQAIGQARRARGESAGQHHRDAKAPEDPTRG